MQIHKFISLICLFSAIQSFGFDHLHNLWDQWVRKHVTVIGGFSAVDYPKVKRDGRLINAYLKSLEVLKDSDIAEFNTDQKLAFWINAYNAYTVKLVLDNYPLKSLQDLGSFMSSVWKKKFFTFQGELRNLDWIEDKIAAISRDPRLVFVLCKSGKGSAALRDEAYVGSRLEYQFNAQADAFVKDPKRGHFDAEKNLLFLSAVIQGGAKQFEQKYGSVQNFVAGKLTKDVGLETRIKNAKIEYQKIDWALNGPEVARALAGE